MRARVKKPNGATTDFTEWVISVYADVVYSFSELTHSAKLMNIYEGPHVPDTIPDPGYKVGRSYFLLMGGLRVMG